MPAHCFEGILNFSQAFVEEQQQVREQHARLAQQQKQIESLTGWVQKISAEIELSKTAPQAVLNDR